MAPTISSPLRLLLLSTPDTPHPACLNEISHHEIQTPYYSASIPVWRDTLPITPSSIPAFRQEWTSSEAGEVVQAVGAWVLCFKKPRQNADLESIRLSLTTIRWVIEHHAGHAYAMSEPLLLAVGLQQTVSPRLEIESEEWEDVCRECGGWEWIDGEIAEVDGPKGERQSEEQRNEFGEKVGIPRLKEALEAHEWEGGDGDTLSDDLTFGSEDGFEAEAAQIEREIKGLTMAVNDEEKSGEGDNEGVEELENTILKVQAIKDMGADMPEAQRRRFAAKAVRDIMKTV